MAKYNMGDGTIINTEKAVQKWNEDTRWDGNNHISIQTGSQWEHQTLYKSKKGRYYIEHFSQRQGSLAYIDVIDEREAAAWLIANNEELPEDLGAYIDQIEE